MPPTESRFDEIRFDRIEPNPFRDVSVNPPNPAQIEALRGSIELTSFWDGLLVRPHPKHKDRYQLAFGHSRLDAAKLHGLDRANFSIVELDDGQMIQHLGVENFTQRGHDEYAVYREVVTAAIEYLMAEVLHNPNGPLRDRLDEAVTGYIRNGGMPGRDVLGKFFGGVLSQKAIRMVLEEYQATGRLAAWHAKHNPKGAKATGPVTLSREALGRFTETAHVKTFADTVRNLDVPVAQQPALADAILTKLKEPERKPIQSKTAENERLNRQWARRDQPRNERLTSNNIRSVARREVAKQLSPKERRRLHAEAAAISIEGAMSEMSIGLRRAAAAASDISTVAASLGGVRVDLTASAQLRLGECRDAIRSLEKSLKAAAGHGVRIPLIGGR